MRCVSGVITAGAGRTEASEHPDGEGRCCGTDVLLLLLGRPRYVRATKPHTDSSLGFAASKGITSPVSLNDLLPETLRREMTLSS